jgi:hypothetical protein
MIAQEQVPRRKASGVNNWNSFCFSWAGRHWEVEAERGSRAMKIITFLFGKAKVQMLY